MPFEIIRPDPFLDIAMEYCIGEKLIQLTNQGKLELTTKAEIFINKLINEKLLKDEYKVLKNIGSRKVTDEKIKMMIGGN